MGRFLAVAAGALLLWVAGLAVAVPAGASCALPPQRSEHSFVGVVLQTSAGDRVATVRRDDGQTVTVRGGETRTNAASSVDRRYEVGVRYEFHPINARDPYEDNECTATRRLPGNGAAFAGNSAAPAAGEASPPPPPAVPVDSGSSPWLIPGLAGLGLAVAGGVATSRTLRRSRSARVHPTGIPRV